MTVEQLREYKRNWYRAHKAEAKAYRKACASKIRAYHKGYRVEHRAEILQRQARWRHANPDKVKDSIARWEIKNGAATPALKSSYARKYRVNNRDKFNAWSAFRHAAKLQATPPWLTAEHLRQIEAFYIEAKRLEAQDGIKRHVDHVYPLQGKTVSGLHVPWNLQILTATDNVKKHNSMPASKIVFGG